MRSGLAAAATLVLMTTTACAAQESGTNGSGFPTTVGNCGNQVRVDKQPQRVVALGPSEVTTIAAAGGTSDLVARNDIGFKSAPYTPSIRDAVASVPQLGEGGEVSRESVIALRPDLVVGSVSENITRESLDAVGIPLLGLRGNCGSGHAPGRGDGNADFADVYSDIDVLGRLLGTQEVAQANITDLRRRVDAVRPVVTSGTRTAAAVIAFQNSLEVYGRASMAHTQFEKLGLKDVFGDVDSRVFDAGIEEVVARDPDVVMLLSYGESDEQAMAAFLRTPGAANLTAVRTGQVFVQPYEYSSQGTLSVNGLENISAHLSTAPATRR